jgi:hypothetical protein
MTNKQKLKKLLQIATDNGYKSYYPISDCWLKDNRDELFTIEGLTISCDVTGEPNCLELSINDIVLDFEYDSNTNNVCFIDALRRACDYENMWCLEDITSQWAFRPNSQRLDFLFDYFSHLLD